MVNVTGSPDKRSRVIFTVFCYQGKALKWIQPYIMEYIDKGWLTKLLVDTVNLLNLENFITQLQTMFEEINLK